MKHKNCRIAVLSIALSAIAPMCEASSLPAPADAARIDVIPEQENIPDTTQKIVAPDAATIVNAPEGSSEIAYELRSIRFAGGSLFSDAELNEIASPYLGDVTLDHLWKVASAVTRYYRDKGYFLSRAYVPEQELNNTTAEIRIIEGHISEVEFTIDNADSYIIRKLTKDLKQQKPISASYLESYMLRINDLGGIDASGVLKPASETKEGAVGLIVKKADKTENIGSIAVNNFGSRFLGAYQATANVTLNTVGLQTTDIYGSVSLPFDELRYIGAQHTVPFYPQWEMRLSGSYVYARPGSNLSAFDIKSDATNMGLGVYYKPIRQRLENLTFGAKFDLQNTNSDIFSDVALSRDRIRVIDISANYNLSDSWNGFNAFDAHYRQGVEWFGASDEGNPLLTRADAEPDFSVFKLYASRQQFLPHNFSINAALSAQISDAPLFSSEEFGYGGRAFGRAYNPSEITGDQGVSSSIELRYATRDDENHLSFMPYGFYDIGKIWEKGTAPDMSASSAGFGMVVSHDLGISLDAGLAFPLTKTQENPLYGNDSNPRAYFQTRFNF